MLVLSACSTPQIVTKVIAPDIPAQLLTCGERPHAPVHEGADARDDNRFKTELTEFAIRCDENNQAIGEIMDNFNQTYADELSQ